MTTSHLAVILKIERALPVDGWPLNLNYLQRSNRRAGELRAVTSQKHKRALPVDGEAPSYAVATEVTAGLWAQGRLLLFVYLQEQAANADNDQTKLKNFRSRHIAAPLSWNQGARSAPC